jgi:hypothetical protein
VMGTVWWRHRGAIVGHKIPVATVPPPPGRSLQRRFIVVGRLIHRMCQKDLVEVALVDKGVSVDRRDVNSLSMPTIKN